MDSYQVIVWDKKANDPFYVVKHSDIEEARQVARNLKRRYVDDWGAHAQSMFEVRLQKVAHEEGIDDVLE